MGQIRSRTNKRTLISYQEFDELRGQSKLICVDLGLLSILRSLVRQRGLWQSTYYLQTLDNNLYEEIELSHLDVVQASVAEFLEEGDLTTCNELTEAIQQLGVSIGGGGGGCGCGSGGAGGADVGPTATTGPADIENPTGDPPEPFATWAEYQDYKCAVANTIWDKQFADVQWALTVNVLSLAVGGFIAALVTPIPGDEIIAFIALLTTLAGLGVYQSGLNAWSLALANAKNELICALYQSQDVEIAIADWKSILAIAIQAETADPIIQNTLALIQAIYTPYGLFNDLFDFSETYNTSIYTAADCPACLPQAAKPLARILGIDNEFVNKSWITLVSGNRYRIEIPNLLNHTMCSTGVTYVDFIWPGFAVFDPNASTYISGFGISTEPCGNANANPPGGGEYGPTRELSGANLISWINSRGPMTQFYIITSDGPFIFEMDFVLV